MSKHLQCLIFCGVFATILVPTYCQQRALGVGAARVQERQREKKILDDILGGTYDSNIRPTGGNSTNGETQVVVNLALNAVSKIDDFNMEYSVQLTLRKEWNDDRLRFAHLDRTNSIKHLTLTDVSKIWIPDIFFINEKSGRFHSIIKPNVYVRIFPDGLVSISIRISLTLACPMDLKLFPMDTQSCAIVMASYAWTTNDLIFRWRDQNPVQLPDLSLPRFTMQSNKTSTCDRETVTGKYSCIRVDFVLIRNFSFYLTQMYIPCIMLVIVSWVSFWLDENAVPARTALGITTLLTMATQQANMNKNLPPVSYTKALDVWSGTCLMFIFAALLEFALVNYATRFDKRTKAKSHEELGHDPVSSGWLSRRYPSTSKKIDVIARILFPLLFISFNIVYWLAYMLSA
ncbi:Glutamate-gated chloride channel [Orchesella cincta]|uniref:Glutamate-gated chloride channel n=1 Tax=Orchesella cincta TaxID=48709 RepID=A0A1D2N8Y5_ORCCI|nr:Glutamate-gated chloride channel [Orchesella cincta]